MNFSDLFVKQAKQCLFPRHRHILVEILENIYLEDPTTLPDCIAAFSQDLIVTKNDDTFHVNHSKFSVLVKKEGDRMIIQVMGENTPELIFAGMYNLLDYLAYKMK